MNNYERVIIMLIITTTTIIIIMINVENSRYEIIIINNKITRENTRRL